MSSLSCLLKFTKKEDSPGKLFIDLNRELFKEIPEFSSAYDGVRENNFREIYSRLYSIYKEKFGAVKITPPLTNPKEFQDEISYSDVLEIEGCLAILYADSNANNLSR
jgi:hypothetical protein